MLPSYQDGPQPALEAAPFRGFGLIWLYVVSLKGQARQVTRAAPELFR